MLQNDRRGNKKEEGLNVQQTSGSILIQRVLSNRQKLIMSCTKVTTVQIKKKKRDGPDAQRRRDQRLKENQEKVLMRQWLDFNKEKKSSKMFLGQKVRV